jgi:mitochondrial-processing peptidase subunit beta
LQAITTQQVRDVCMKYVYDRCPAVAAVGPVENLPDYARIRSSMYWLRI